jgi:arylformamidase
MARFQAESALMRSFPSAHLGLRYGDAPRCLIDYFAADAPGPLVVFFHGGYWQMRAKEDFSFIADSLLAHGLHVALVGYTLAPEATLAQIVDEARNALSWLRAHAVEHGGDAHRMVSTGWSAGAHLVAMTLGEAGIAGGLALSGIYDLEPVRLTYVNEKLRLAASEVRALSPLHLPADAPPLVVAYGDAELPELQRQSRDFFDARMAAGQPVRLLPLPGLNHFTVLREWADPQGQIVRAVRELAQTALR